MTNFLREFYDFIRLRLLGFGGDVPSTEAIQQSILRLCADHGKVSADFVIVHLYNNHPVDRMLREVLQAAQILVNHGQLHAFSDGRIIDPVYGTSETIFTLANVT
ncbi:MAG: hypothetical protein R3261_13455 [Alphaproteobacteria bacterium]|nr:hypothetical protein [Alphaproteobacteria bacterium]